MEPVSSENPKPHPLERAGEVFRSRRNGLLLRFRNALGFRRAGYREAGSLDPLPQDARELEKRYDLVFHREELTKEVYAKNLATLFVLEKMLGGLEFGAGDLNVLEPGCQDFARLPALKSYFRQRGLRAQITGLEVDAYPLLLNLHSRADKARYYIWLEEDGDRFEAADFFAWQEEPVPLVFSFYPFVSPDPALAWGLPSHFGRAELWVRAFERNLSPGGHLLVVNQGEWEQEAFDEARAGSLLELVKRENVDCPFYPLPYPACASLYRRLP